MMKRRTILIFLILINFNFTFFSQNKEVKGLLKEAQLNFETEDYFSAYTQYSKVLMLDKKNELAGLNGSISGFKINYPLDSFLVFIAPLTSSSFPDAKYYLAKIYHKQKRFNEAIALLEAYKKENPEKKRSHSEDEINYLTGVCNNALKFIASPHRSVIKNMGPEINSEFSDYVPVIMPDESALYFTSRRPGSSNNKKDALGYLEDVYVSYKVNDKWTRAENVGPPINSEQTMHVLQLVLMGKE